MCLVGVPAPVSLDALAGALKRCVHLCVDVGMRTPHAGVCLPVQGVPTQHVHPSSPSAMVAPQEARNLSSETFSKFIMDINRRVEALLKKE